MPNFEITAPDGTKYHVTGPEGATEQDALAQVQAQHAAPATPEPAADPSAGGGEILGIPTSQGVDRAVSGFGKAFVDLGRGAGQFLGFESRKDVADSRALDAPLMATTAGKVGNIVGNVAATAPAMAIPGAASVPGAAALGTAFGALQPSTSTKETLTNTGLGAATGALGQFAGNALTKAAGSKLLARQAASTEEASQNAVRDQTLKAARDAGYVVPPATSNPGATSQAVESIAGKAATQSAAALKNQKVTNSIVRTELGMGKNAPITEKALGDIRSKAGQVYAQVKGSGVIQTDQQYLNDVVGLTNGADDITQNFAGASVQAGDKIQALADSLAQDKFTASSAVEYVKNLRKQSSANFKTAYASGGDPDKLALAHAQWDAAGSLEDMIGRHLSAQGQPELATAFDKARVTIAKTYSAQSALNPATGNIVAKNLATQLKRGKKLSDGFEAIGRFAQAFPKAATEQTESRGVSALGAVAGIGGALLHHPALLAVSPARYAVRNALLTKAGQRLGTPSYAPNALGTGTLNSLKLFGKGRAPLALAGSNALVQSAQQ